MASYFRKFSRFRSAILSALILSGVVFVYATGVFPFLDQLELRTIDLRFVLRGAMAPNPGIVLAVVDEKSIDREGKWPWPRTKIAALIRKLSDAGAKVVALDIGFLEPEGRQVQTAIDEVENKIGELGLEHVELSSFLNELRERADFDRTLAEGIERSAAKVVLGFFFHTDRNSAEHMGAQSPEVLSDGIKGARYGVVRYSSQKAKERPLFKAVAPQPNIPAISKSSPYAGYFNMTADPDGVVRRIASVIEFDDELYAPLSVATAAAFLDESPSLFLNEHGVETIKIGGLEVPSDEYGRVMINYRGGSQTYPHVSVADILNGKVEAEPFKNGIVLVGVTAVAVYDLRVTPFGGVFPGLEIHANVIDSIFSGDALYQPEWFWLLNLFLIVATGVALGVFLHESDAVSGGFAAIGMFSGYFAICVLLFWKFGWVLNLTYPLAVVVLIYIGVVSHRYFTESRQKRFVKDTFSTFVSADVVQQLLESPEKIVLGGEEREITAFFSDVQGFTGISEKLSPKELVELLNEFLTEMADIIMRHKGMVDKFEGDAIIAMFGAPSDLSNHPEAACLASIEMQKRLERLRENWKKMEKPELKMRIGLCSGSAVVGNMGSRNRMDYTMMGDTVNTAARLEGVNKVYGTYTLMGESTRRAAGDWIAAREIDSIRVVGKQEALTIYELLGYPKDVDGLVHEAVANYAKGLYAYRGRDWNRAIIFFNKALSAVPDDGPSRTMLERCNYLKVRPPGKRWDGAFTLRSK